jgi:hypothetical protein
MAIFTSNYLKNVSRGRTMNESVNLSAQHWSTHNTFDIFLCHSFLDKEEVEGLYLELSRRGLKVYVDWIIDPQLERDNVTKETAELVRKRLRSSRSLLLAISHNAELSKWVPWELGYVDGHTQRCALVPVSKDNVNRSAFHRSEYLKLYPFIEKPNDLSTSSDSLFAVEDNYNYVDFQSWLTGSAVRSNTRNFF